jgi:aspartate kinase
MDGVNARTVQPRIGRGLSVNRPIKVMKFGGTSVGAAERLRRIVEIVQGSVLTHRVVVVASAANGVTDLLVSAWDAAGKGESDPDALYDALYNRYYALASEILSPAGVSTYEPALRQVLSALVEIFEGMKLEGQLPPFRDALLAVGERASVPLVAQAIHEAGVEAEPFDAAVLIRTDDHHGQANVDLERTSQQVRRWFQKLAPGSVAVVTGFIGGTANGAVTTLGRGGSDYSAALFASALKAEVLERWTDVDGIYTDDPRKNQNARRLACIVLEEAWSWNQAGKLGMHRKALDPLVVAGIAVHVRCTATPDHPGTLILPAGHEAAHLAVGLLQADYE